MGFLNDGAAIMNYDSEGAAATNQTATWQVSCSSNTPETVEWVLGASLAQSGGATSPTAEVLVQFSFDGESWITLATFGTDGTDQIAGSLTNTSVPKYVRAVLTVAGGTKPAVVCVVHIYASAGFDLTAVA